MGAGGMTAPSILLDFSRCGRVIPRATFSRVSSGAYISSDSVSWRVSPPGMARLHYTNTILDGLLVEPQRVNAVPNSRCEGGTSGVIGSGGALPTGFSYLFSNEPITGLDIIVTVGIELPNKLPGFRLRFVRAGSGESNVFRLQWTSNTTIVAAPSQTWRSSFWVRLVAGSVPNNLLQHQIIGRNSAGSAVSGNTFNTGSFNPTTQEAEYSAVQTLTSDSSIARVTGALRLQLPANTALDFTIEVAAPHMVQNSWAGSPILAPVGTPAATTRAEDSLSALISEWGLSPTTAGTLFVEGRFSLGSASFATRVVSIDSGSDADRVTIERLANQTIRADVVVGSVSQATATTTTTVSDGSKFRAAVAFAPGDLALSLNGDTPITASPSNISSTMNRIRVAGMMGVIGRIAYWPQRLPNSTLQSLTI